MKTNSKQRPQIDLESALIFISDHGNLQEKARLLAILLDERPTESITRPLLNKQNIDGGFPSRPRSDSPSSVDNTLTALWQLNELRLLDIPEAFRAIKFLVSAQMEDGGWDENPELPQHDLPPWIQPGEMATRLYLTAYSAYWLSIARHQGSDAFHRACLYLCRHQNETDPLFGYFHTLWIATSVFFMADQSFRKIATKCLATMESRPMIEWEDSQIAWALDCLGSAGLTDDHPFIIKNLEELALRQNHEGSWSLEEGNSYAVSTTISAIKVFLKYGWVENIL